MGQFKGAYFETMTKVIAQIKPVNFVRDDTP
jgi:hypothetical protein